MSRVRWVAVFAAMCGAAPLAAEQLVQPTITRDPTHELHAVASNGDYEAQLLAVIDAIQSGQLRQALEQADTHLSQFPKSRVGHFLRAEVLMAMSGDTALFGARASIPEEVLRGLVHQLKNRWQHRHDNAQALHTRLPADLVLMGKYQHVLVADLTAGRLYVYANNDGRPKLVRDYYLTMGSQGFGKQVEGDNKTPIGIYRVTRHIEGKALPDLYGKGAFPVDYPNRYDRYLGRTGYGIWLHGTPSDTYARAPWSSEGCFVLSNDDLLDVAQFVDVQAHTPVLLSEQVAWLDQQDAAAQQAELLAVIARWEKDWEAIDTDALIAHYSSENFNLGHGDFAQWAARKKQVNRAKTDIDLELEIHSLFRYPGKAAMFEVTFTQHYASNNFSNTAEKRQLWQKNSAGRWQIIFEGKPKR
ncbi:hypothetical protein GCM10008090_19720 [Arenicella chitinivorans]|uniref:L,D-TPase catalytic domain-containing protein n=1 Tax=Arenicella chitinivorans TaxID=1329800 RepID=A0A918VNH1_9GAMM|nr:L,D-transpeptidase family protein [Arenicella chitinivorans]GHA10213.1 hypothetical protein GCM10008090_19720 [Arenicella chitinivorans]